MNNYSDTLKRINDLPEPRHMFVLPIWLNPGVLDRLIDEGYLTCTHFQRDTNGVIQVAMALRLTSKGRRLIQPEVDWQRLAWKGSLAGASLMAMSVVILYLG